VITDKILKKIKSKKKGWIFCAKDFKDLGTRNAIDKALSRMADDNASNNRDKIIRIIRGIYYFPVIQDGIGIIPPSLDEIANAIARNSGITIYPSGAKCANILGLSNQVSGQNIYWTHGKSLTKKIGKNTIIFKHIRTNPAPNIPSIVMIVLNALKSNKNLMLKKLVLSNLNLKSLIFIGKPLSNTDCVSDLIISACG
jgi:hypothetical protein